MAIAITSEVKCRSRGMTVWTKACECARCQKQASWVRMLNDQGRYERVSAAAGLAALDKMIALGYNGPAIASACGYIMSVSTATGWITKRKHGRDIQLGPVAARALAQAKEPTAGRTSGLVATRKLRALARMGWGVKEIGEAMVEHGLCLSDPRVSLYRVRSGDLKQVRVSLLHAINQAYRLLEMRPAPSDRRHNYTRAYARANQWAAPLAWEDIEDPYDRPSGRRSSATDRTKHKDSVDPSVVERMCEGDIKGIVPTPAERVAVIAELRRRGLADGDIERRTGIKQVKARHPNVAPSKEEVH